MRKKILFISVIICFFIMNFDNSVCAENDKMDHAINEFNNLNTKSATDDSIFIERTLLEEDIYWEKYFLTQDDSMPPLSTGINRYRNGEYEILGFSPLGMYVYNPDFPADSLVSNLDEKQYVYTSSPDDISVMQTHPTIGSTIPDTLYYDSDDITDEIYMVMAIALRDTFPDNLSDNYIDKLIEAEADYVINNDASVFRNVRLLDTASYEEIGIDEVVVITALPTTNAGGSFIIFHSNADWYMSFGSAPLSTYITDTITGTTTLNTTTTIPETTTTLDATLYLELQSSLYLTNYTIYDHSTNISIDSDYLSQDITSQLNYSTNIPISIDTTEDITDVSISILGTNENGNTIYLTATESIEKVASIIDIATSDSSSDTASVTTDNMDPNASGVILADTRRNEAFDVTEGIPASQDLYVNIFANEYIFEESYEKVEGSIEYSVQVNKDYYLTWKVWNEKGDRIDTDGDGANDTWEGEWVDTSLTQTVSYTYSVSRDYLYYIIDHLEIYEIDSSTINNDSLDGETLIVSPTNYQGQTIVLNQSTDIDDHILEPADSSTTVIVTLESESLNGGILGQPDVPTEQDFSSYADEAIGEIQVKNDHLEFNGEVIMDGSQWHTIESEAPSSIPEPELIDEDTLYARNLTIDIAVENGIYNSTGVIAYKRIESVNSIDDETIHFPIDNLNQVVVHTPVVCDGGIMSQGNYNQEINSDDSRASLILGKETKIKILTEGQHLSIKGYDNQDYQQYTKTKQIRFPFDVYIDTNYREVGKYLAANNWYDVPLDTDLMDIYIPIWVDEGDYTVEYRSVAINNGSDTEEEGANLDITNYIATDSSPVRIVGRLYGFQITDITDYDTWESVFRIDDSTEHSDNYFLSGENDENGDLLGIDLEYTLPVMDGSHPTYTNYGALKTGYKFRFEITTIGDYKNEEDNISIYPKFYYESYDGTNRQEVDLYYHEYFNDQTNYFVKIGGDYNRKNTKYIELDEPYRNVSETEIEDTSRILGITEDEMRYNESKIGWFDFTVLSKPLRTFIGDTNDIPSTVDSDVVLQAKQKWYGEYYLPNEVFAAPVDYDVLEYSRTNNGLDGNENFWLTEGYIIVNFEIETVKDGDFDNPILSYENGSSANMWVIEGYDEEKADDSGVTFDLDYGDIIFYYTDKKASDDYASYGTH